ncbi:MAG: hypothetical protein FD167_4880, partial [bacterium]
VDKLHKNDELGNEKVLDWKKE